MLSRYLFLYSETLIYLCTYIGFGEGCGHVLQFVRSPAQAMQVLGIGAEESQFA